MRLYGALCRHENIKHLGRTIINEGANPAARRSMRPRISNPPRNPRRHLYAQQSLFPTTRNQFTSELNDGVYWSGAVARLPWKVRWIERDGAIRVMNPGNNPRVGFPPTAQGSNKMLQLYITALIRQEREEYVTRNAQIVRGMTELMLMQAIRYGPCHSPTMRMVQYWMHEPQMVYKIFDVLVPRFSDPKILAAGPLTKSYMTPIQVYNSYKTRAEIKSDPKLYRWTNRRMVVEIRGNPLPPLDPLDPQKLPKHGHDFGNHSLVNTLIKAAKAEYHSKQSLHQSASPLDKSPPDQPANLIT